MFKSTKVQNEKELKKLAKTFANSLNGGEIILLQGDLGAGKTTFVRHVLRALGYKGMVNSPTFTIMQHHIVKKFNVYHFDMYRLEVANEASNFGFEEYIYNDDINSLVFIEWPENIVKWLKGEFIVVRILKTEVEDERVIEYGYSEI